jgi:hypothetical protein
MGECPCLLRVFSGTNNLNSVSIRTFQTSPHIGYQKHEMGRLRANVPNLFEVDFVQQLAAIPAARKRRSKQEEPVTC